MLLAIDAGNTNIVFAVCDGGKILGQWRMGTDARRTADEYGVWLLQVLERAGVDPQAIDAAILCSVVPQAVFALKTLCRQYFDTELLMVGGQGGIRPGMPVKIERANEVGADRLVNALAAWTRYKKALVIVDFGTATTFDVVSGQGEYIGGVIAPGVNLSLDALQRAAAKLPNVAIDHPAKVIGTSTTTAMQSGIYFGYLGMIEGILGRITQEYGAKMLALATGGLAPLFAKGSAMIEQLEPNLTIEGLCLIYQARSSGSK